MEQTILPDIKMISEKKVFEKQTMCKLFLDNLSKCINGSTTQSINTTHFIPPNLKFGDFNFKSDCFDSDLLPEHPAKTFVNTTNPTVEYYKYPTIPVPLADYPDDYITVNQISHNTLSCITLQTDLSGTKPHIKILVSTGPNDFLSNYMGLK